MPSGGRRSSTWTKGQKPPVQKPKGALNKKTRVKKLLGTEGWEQLTNFIEGQGAEKLVKEMKKLTGQSYVHAMQQMSEYVKPKLRRVDSNISGNLTLKGAKVVFK